MTAQVIYDSNYGNTKLVAEAVAQELGAGASAVASVTPDVLNGLDLIVVGSPINAWRPTERILRFLAGLKPGQLNNVKAAAFDTRVKLFIHGDAAKKISAALAAAGATIVAEPTGFIVKGKEGPIVDGEIERAKEWARSMASTRS